MFLVRDTLRRFRKAAGRGFAAGLGRLPGVLPAHGLAPVLALLLATPAASAAQPATDADLVIYDPDYRSKISVKTQQMAVDYSAFEGWDLKGSPSLVTVRGQIQVRDGKFVGKLGSGQFLSRPATHF